MSIDPLLPDLADWQRFYQQLQAFARQFGHPYVPASDPQWSQLYQWSQRQQRDKPYLSPAQVAQLDQLGFYWGGAGSDNDRRWDAHLEALKAFQREHGHCRVVKGWHDKALVNWVAYQRCWQHRLSDYRKQQLDAIGFIWATDLVRELQQQWDHMYEQLVNFHRQYGHCRVTVPKSPNSSLFSWVRGQRKKRSKLSAERQQKLRALGFIWQDDIAREKVQQWETMYGQLVDFHRQHGHSRVPTRWPPNQKLSGWVQFQRHKQSRLPAEKKARLDALGFLWNAEAELVQRWAEDWRVMYERLLQFHQQHGHCRVPPRTQPDTVLYRWVKTQRRDQYCMPAERRQLLEALQFTWSKDTLQNREARWEEKFEQLRAFREAYGHCRVPGGWKANPQLANWVKDQRSKRDSVPPYRREKLESLSFEWQVKPPSKNAGKK